MNPEPKSILTVQAQINAPLEEVWRLWTEPAHIIHWNAASDDWHTPRAENDLKVGGRFAARMEAKDGSFGFDFEGIYVAVVPNQLLEYSIGDGRTVKVTFTSNGTGTTVQESFEAEGTHSIDQQREGWQAILNRFKAYAEFKTSPQRELRTSRVLDFPVALVWQAWSDPRHLAKWWGPNGFSSTFSDFEFRVGGHSKFVMHGPDGSNYDNELVYAEIVPHEKLVLDHVNQPHFQAIVTFTPRGQRTEVSFRQIFETVEICQALRPICEPANEQNLDRATEVLRDLAAAAPEEQGDREFVIMRTFNAPRQAVYEAWTKPELLSRWWGPETFSCPVCELDLRPGGAYRIVMRAPEGNPHVKGDFPIRGQFGEITPDRIVMIHDATEHPPEWHDLIDPNRGGNPNPAGLMRQTAFFEDRNGRTTLTIRTRLETPAIKAAMERMGMALGWSGSLDRLARLLANP